MISHEEQRALAKRSRSNPLFQVGRKNNAARPVVIQEPKPIPKRKSWPKR